MTSIDEDNLFGRLGPVLVGLQPPIRAPHTFSHYGFGGKAVSPECGRTSSRSPGRLLNKRKLYWRHHRRNQALTALAAGVAANGVTTAVLVETSEHANHLQELLPSWPVIRYPAMPAEMPASMVITLTAATKWDEFRPAQLVVAMGGPPSAWISDWLGQMGEAGQSVRVVDLQESFSVEAAQLARARHLAYRQAGCHWRPLSNAIIKQAGRQLRDAQQSQKSRRKPSS